MTFETTETILAAGRNVALRKMTHEKNLMKPDMRVYSFAELQTFLEQ